jgi:large subunit ribosomal protein L13
MLQQKSFQAKQKGPHIHQTKGASAPKWYTVDAEGQVVGRLATILARVITGKHKPTYTEHADVGDFVIVLNADKVSFTGRKWDDKKYFWYTGFIGGMKKRTAKEMLIKNPTEILRHAVYGMTNKSILAQRQMKKLKIYVGTEHEHAAQKAQPMPASATRKTILSAKKLSKTKTKKN